MPASRLPALQLAVFDHLLDGTQRQSQTLGGFGSTAIFFSGVSGVTAMSQSGEKNKRFKGW
jgi:hypothetical protein